MMRRTRFALAAKASLFRPIFDFLMTKQPGRTSDWARDAALLHKCNVHTPDCWAHLSAGQKQAIVGKGLPQTIADLLDAETSATADNIRHKKVLVAFGSQTGTAESYAKMLSIFATSHGYVPILCSLNDAVQVLEDNKTSKQIDAMLIVTSTYGTGEFPTNSEKFFKDLSAGRLSESLQGIRYTIMGLGNSANDHFNNAAKKIDKSLQAAGAKSFLRTQLSCELQPNGHDNVFRGWKRGIWTALGDASGTATTALPATYEVAMVHAPEKVVARPHYFRAHVQGNILLSKKDYTPESRLLTFTVPVRVQTDELGRRARITDQIQIHPRNCKAAAERAAKLLGVNLKDSVEITPKSGAPHSFFDGRKILVETVLRDIIDLSAAPSRTLIDTVASACADEAERAKLDDLANDLSADSKYTALLAKGFTMMDLLEMCPSIKINMAQLISLAPQIAPRTYSVAKDNSEWLPEEFEICYNIPTKANHKGLCTQMMSQLEVGDDFLMKFIPDVATTPQNKNPLLIVALGSGIGTARSLLHRRKLAKARGEQVGRVCLYYGFRELGNDQLFTKELQEFVDDGLLDVRYVPSTDAANGGKYVTPMDKMDRSIVDFLGAKGEFSYCGLGGSVPLKVESALQKNGVDTAALRASGRYHEEYFTADQDVENLLKHNGVGAADASTLLGRMGNTDMFCFQCEQTQNGKGCTKVGVCGKTSRVAALQDLTVHAAKVIGFYADRLRKMDEPVSNEVNRFTLYSLFATLTNVNFDESRFVDILGNASKHVIQLRDQYKTACSRKGVTPEETYGVHLPVPLTSNVDSLVDLGRQVGVLRRFSDPATQSGAAVSEMLVYGLKGVAAYTDHALMNGREEPQIYEYMHRALAFMAGPDNLDLAKALPLALEAGQANVSSMSLLYNSNKSLGVPTPTVAHVKPVKGKAILVSGHDLIMLKGLLEKTEPLGINVYTHGEMLPAHGYPALKKHKNLVGHYGGAWMRQSVEFPEFPGAIMMTTNCLTEPKESYGDRLFTAGAVGWKGVPHLGNTMADLDFAPLIKSAQEARGFVDEKEFSYADPAGQKRPDSLTVGFGHETILSVAPTLLEAIQKGDITRFFVIGGCDGFEGQRSYYTELVQNLPPTAVILTLGCGKYRLNHLDKGTIGNTGIPRILDMGQCNDAFGAVQVASALASALKCEINDLPLNIVLSWFEQKAVAVLLSCLHLGLKGIHIGPTLPAFVTPEVLNVLVNDFGVRPLGDPAEDAKKMCAGTK